MKDHSHRLARQLHAEELADRSDRKSIEVDRRRARRTKNERRMR